MRSLWRRRSVKLAAALVLLAGGPAFGQQGHFRHRGYVRPPQPYCPPPQFVIPPAACPPVVPPQPVPSDSSESSVPPATSDSQNPQASANPPATDNTQNPQNPPQDQVNNQAPVQQQFDQALANVDRQGTGFSGDAPNMIGDFLGFTGAGNFSTNSPAFDPLTLAVTGPSLTGLIPIPNLLPGGFDVTIPSTATAGGVPLGENVTLVFDGTGAVQNIGSLSASQQSALIAFLSRQGSSIAGLSGTVDPISLNDISATTGGPTTDLTLGGIDNFLVGGFSPNQLVFLPRTGVEISRFKASEQTSPIPRDRILFGYGFFNSVNGPGGSGDVNRFVPGFEKTFNEGYSSLEVRMPFASTFDSYQPMTATGQIVGTTNTEFGNLTLALKHLLATTERSGLSVGMSIELPTADDIEFENGAFYVRRNSESVHLAPFVGHLYTPTDRTFFQSFAQVSFDANGEHVIIADKITNQTGGGILQDAATLFVDFQAGYWFYRNLEVSRSSQISGIAGILEMHFNQTVQDTDYVSQTVAGVPFQFGNPNYNFGVANLTSGITTEFGQQSTLTCAYVVPLSKADRQFDSELQVMFNYYFDKQGSPFRVPNARAMR